jgi:hypothetical protein
MKSMISMGCCHSPRRSPSAAPSAGLSIATRAGAFASAACSALTAAGDWASPLAPAQCLSPSRKWGETIKNCMVFHLMGCRLKDQFKFI